MYELFTGERAFGGHSAALVRLLVLHDSPRPMDEIVTGFPDALAAIVAKAMEKDRCAALSRNLDALAADLRDWRRDNDGPEQADRVARLDRTPADSADASSPGLDGFLGEWEDAVGRVYRRAATT